MISQKNVLVVDDDPFFKLITKKLFERVPISFKVHFAENGQDAIDHLSDVIDNDKDAAPDIILLDIEMPIMNGWGFMEEFIKIPEEKRKQIDVYTISSSIAQEDKEKAASYPQIKAYITKPLTVDIIKSISE